jgi:hypothetical protein
MSMTRLVKGRHRLAPIVTITIDTVPRYWVIHSDVGVAICQEMVGPLERPQYAEHNTGVTRLLCWLRCLLGDEHDVIRSGRLATDLDLGKLNSMTSGARLDDVPALAAEVLAGKTRGRVIIDL